MNNISDWIYCKIRLSNKTQFGIEKVRSRQPACDQFDRAWEKKEGIE
jgi:hypothetical protein